MINEKIGDFVNSPKLSRIYPEIGWMCDPALLPTNPDKKQVFAAYAIFGLRALELALYFQQDKQRIARYNYCWVCFISKTKKETHY